MQRSLLIVLEMLGSFLNLNKMKITLFQNKWANILFTIEHRKHNKCLNWEMLKCYAQNEIISNLMPATGLKIVGTGHVYHGVASPLLFKSVWRHLGIEVMGLGSFSVGIWSHSCLIWVSICWRVCGRLWRIFRLLMRQMFSIAERSGLQQDNSAPGLFYCEAMLL